MTDGKRILIVEDDERLADFISTYLKNQDFEVFIEGRAASLGKQQLSLSSAEFDLLLLLAQHAGKVISRETAFRTFRGRMYDGLDRTIDARISKLRKILGDNPKAP